MTAKDAIHFTFAMNDRMLEAYLGDLSDTDLTQRPVPGQNHIAWQLGHLITSERSMLEGMRPGFSPPLPEGFVEAHNKDACTSNNVSMFSPKKTYLELFQAQRAATRKVLDGMSEADLDVPAPERLRRMAPTVGDAFCLVGTHVMMHVGQFVAVRRLLKKPIAF
jgi:hypothetical protein